MLLGSRSTFHLAGCGEQVLMNATTDWYAVEKIASYAYRIIEGDRYGMYLLRGSERSLLIDAGIGIGDLPKLTHSLVDTPITLVLTHGHWDHIGSAADFESVHIHENELSPTGHLSINARSDDFVERPSQFVAQWQEEHNEFPDSFDPATYTIGSVEDPSRITDGEILALGDRELEVIHTPGHAPGHCVLLDRVAGDLYGGDIIHGGSGLYIHFTGCRINHYIESFNQLLSLRDEDAFDRLLTGHNPPFHHDELGLLERLQDGLIEIQNDTIEYTIEDTNWGPARLYDIQGSPVYTTDPPQ